MNLTYNNKEYKIEIIRKNNKNTYIRVKNSAIIITTNYFTTNSYIKKLIKDNYNSITKMIDKDIKRNTNDDKFILFNKHYEVIYNDNIKNIELVENKLYTKDDKTLNKWLDKYIHQTFTNHLFHYYTLFEENIPKPTLRIRSMKTRWGVCNTKTHNITLNKELYKKDIECLKYVCIHELSHLIEANHSKSFWKVVEKYCPNYKELRKKLKD